MEKALRICLVCLVALAVQSVCNAADVSEVHVLYIEDYENGVSTGEWTFRAFIMGSGLVNADIELPDTSTQSLSDEGGGIYGYWSSEYASLASLQAAFPAGIYNVAWNLGVKRDQGHVDVAHSPSEPGGIATITNPLDGATDVDTDPMYTWTLAPSHADVLSGSVFRLADDSSVYSTDWTDASYPAYSWQPGVLDPGTAYEIVIGMWDGGKGDTSSAGGDPLSTFSFHGLLNAHSFCYGEQRHPRARHRRSARPRNAGLGGSAEVDGQTTRNAAGHGATRGPWSVMTCPRY